MKTARLLAATVLLAGCDGPDVGHASVANAPSATETVARTGFIAQYEACLAKAETPEANARCADAAVAATTRSDGAFAAFLRDLGDAALAGDDTASHRLVVADAAARLAIGRAALLAGQSDHVSPKPVSPKGQVVPALTARWKVIRDADCARSAVPARCMSVADRLFDAYVAATMPADQETPRMTARPVADCSTLLASTADPQTLLDAFERDYPAAYADPARVDDAVRGEEVPELARSLACLAGVTAFEGFLADQASALFASPRHGRAAFAALAAAGKGEGREAEYARRFADQMRAVIRPPAG